MTRDPQDKPPPPRIETSVALCWGPDTLARLNSDPTVSFWLKRAVTDLARRDPLDALHDCEVLTALMQDRFEETCRAAEAAIIGDGKGDGG